MRILGVMSGTSCDGLDCCVADIDFISSSNLEFKIINFPSNNKRLNYRIYKLN